MSLFFRHRLLAMRGRLHAQTIRVDRGFTLVELLIVIIIIGVLAGIAIPLFVNQRTKAWDAQAKSDLNSMSLAEESYLTTNGSYTTVMTDLPPEGFKPTAGATDSIKGINGGTSYCLKSISQSGTVWYFGSASGGPTTTACTTS
jgi:type IV pilus assembly protein PilA